MGILLRLFSASLCTVTVYPCRRIRAVLTGVLGPVGLGHFALECFS